MKKLILLMSLVSINYVFAIDNTGNNESVNLTYLPVKYDATRNVPAGSFGKITTISGVEISTKVTNYDPVPIIFNVNGTIVMPNQFGVNLKNCKLIGAAAFDSSIMRTKIRLEKLSCINQGKDLQVKVRGFVVDLDGKAGIKAIRLNNESNVYTIEPERQFTAVFSNGFTI